MMQVSWSQTSKFIKILIGIWGTQYDISLIISVHIGADIADMVDVAHINNIDAKNHCPVTKSLNYAKFIMGHMYFFCPAFFHFLFYVRSSVFSFCSLYLGHQILHYYSFSVTILNNNQYFFS